MQIKLTGNDIKKIVFNYLLKNILHEDVDVKEDDLKFRHEVGNDQDGYYMEESEPFEMVIEDKL